MTAEPPQQPSQPPPPGPHHHLHHHQHQPLEPGYPLQQPVSLERELADRVPGAVPHDVYAEAARLQAEADARFVHGLPPLAPPGPPPAKKPSAWNLPAFVMLGIFLIALGAVLWPQLRARATEAKVRPLVTGMAQRDTGARCPRYITAMFGVVGSVSLDSNGNVADRTDLTAPICNGLRHFYTPEGKREMACLLTDERCTDGAINSIISLSVVAHEAMHLRGILDEREAECSSISEGPNTGVLAGLTADQGRMIAYLHLVAMNPSTPSEYGVSAGTCLGAADLISNPPGTPSQRGLLQMRVEETWARVGD